MKYEQSPIYIFTRRLFIIGLMLVGGLVPSAHAAVVNHDISKGNLIIAGTSTDDYVVTGSTTRNYVIAHFGYKGTITLRNCSFRFTSSGIYSPIRIEGKDGLSNSSSLRTNVNLVLDGYNEIYNSGYGRACIQVDQGAQINISAIESCDNTSGTLVAMQSNSDGGAAIGALDSYNNSNETQGSTTLNNGSSGEITAGGNIVISSGTVTAQGGHGAGLGGGYGTWYDGMIVVYGGVVNATCIRHAAGIGSGCPEGSGVSDYYPPNSAIIALPPAQITASGATGNEYVPVPSLALAGTKVRVYIGDPERPTISVRTVDMLAGANVYVDLSQDPDINNVVSATINPSLLDINQVLFGATDATGWFRTTGSLQNNTTFFTDATSTSASTLGHPYLPTVKALPNGGDVQLNMLQTDFSIVSYASTGINVGYTQQEARQNATCVKIVYGDADPITDLVFDLANGSGSDFMNPIFLAADSSTVISAPTSLRKGDIYYVVIPIQADKPSKEYSDVLRIIGNWKGESTSYIRQIVNQVVANAYTETICEGESYLFNGEQLTKSGTYTSVSTSTTGCKTESAVEMLELIVAKKYDVTETVTVREQDLPYTWRDVVIPRGTTSQTLTYKRQSSQGCDSTVRVKLTVYPTYNLREQVAICPEELPYVWRDTTFKTGTTSGTYVFRRRTIHDCDSTVTLQLTVYPSPVVRQQTTICSDDLPFTWRDTIFQVGTESKEVVFHRHTVNGCDSTVQLTLTVHPSYHNTERLVICQNDLPYAWRDTLFGVGTVSSNHSFSRKTVHGCDSTTYLQLVVNPVTQYSDTVILCQNETLQWHGQTIHQAGKVRDEHLNMSGCDSTYELIVKVVPIYYKEQRISICEGEVYDFGGRKLTDPGVYYDSLTSQFGCDSVTKLTLSVYPSYVQTERITTCHREQFYFRDKLIEGQGVYDDTLLTVHGCDSIIRLVYTVNPTYLFVKQDTIKEGQTYTWRGKELTDGGVYWDSLATVHSCDSIYKLTLVPVANYYFEDTVQLCDAETYTWHGKTYTQSGVYTDKYRSVLGTDSIYTLHLSLNKPQRTRRQVTLCPNEHFLLRGKEYFAPCVFEDTLTSYFGCDSICEYVLVNGRDFHKTISICRESAGMYEFQGKQYAVPGYYTIEERTVDGCDSIYELDLRVKENITLPADTITICEKELPFTFLEKPYTSAGIYYDNVVTEDCGKTTMPYVIIVGAGYRFTTNATSCAFSPYSFHGETFTESGTYEVPFVSRYGCDSIYELNLTITPPVKRTVADSICAGETYMFHSRRYTRSGTYVDSICEGDQAVQTTLKLYVVHPSELTYVETQSVCADDSVFELAMRYEGEQPRSCWVYTDNKAQKYGMKRMYHLPVLGNVVQIPKPAGMVQPDVYTLHLTLDNEYCDTLAGINTQISVGYPSTIMDQNWNDVVAVKNAAFNGGYNFTSYQWEVNGQTIGGANQSILYLPGELQVGDEVVCHLTRAGDGFAIATCPLVVQPYTDTYQLPFIVSPTRIPRTAPRTTIKAKRDFALRLFDVSGRMVSEKVCKDSQYELTLPAYNGIYLLQVMSSDGEHQTYKLIVE